jgi:hypothetical protein
MTYNYGSRMDQTYSDDESQGVSDENGSKDEQLQTKDKMSQLKFKQDKLRMEMQNFDQMIEQEHQKKVLGMNSDIEIKPNPRFKNFNDVLSQLTKSKNVPTKYPLVSVTMTYHSKYAITVTKKDDSEYYIKIYSLERHNLIFEEVLGGGDDDYIKCKDIE